MKKTYIKITSLICALILVVMVLGCTLFTYIQIDKINTAYVEDIHKATKATPQDYENDNGFGAEIIEDYCAYKYFLSTYNHDIGYYGKTNWKWKTADYTHTIVSFDFCRSTVVLISSEDNNLKFKLNVGDESGNNAVYYHNPKSGRGMRIVSVAGFKEATDMPEGSIKIDIIEDEDTEPVSSYSDTNKLDLEAQKLFDEIAPFEKEGEKLDYAKTGWFTSHVVHYSSSTVNKGIVDVDSCDVYVFHPFSQVFHNYGYVYLIFLLVLIVLLLIAIVSMRRMYKNRLQFEARSKSLTRSFAHELKTPLAVTKAYVENWELVDEKERPEVAAKINSEVDHMTRMVNTLLDLSKMDSGDVDLKLEEVELYDLSKVCYKHLEKIAKEKEITFDFGKDKEDGEYIVSADLDMMQMVISNFMSNAIKYGKKKVSVFLSGDSNNVTFKITNDGDPISKKDQKKIWDLFYKKDKSGTDRLNSNGVGLAVNKSILELHKAKFGVTGGDQGTAFWFEMKRAKE